MLMPKPHYIHIQSNTANTDTEGAVKNVHINGVSVLNRLNLEKMEGLSFPRDEANFQVM